MDQLEREIAELREELLLQPQYCEEITLKAGLTPCFVRFCNWGLVVFPRSQLEAQRTTRYVKSLYSRHSENQKLISRLVQVFDSCVVKDGKSDRDLVRRAKAILPGRIGKVTPAELFQCMSAGAYWLIKVTDHLQENQLPKIKIGQGDIATVLCSKEIRDAVVGSRGFVLDRERSES